MERNINPATMCYYYGLGIRPSLEAGEWFRRKTLPGDAGEISCVILVSV